MDPRDFLELAGNLANSALEPAAARNRAAISRAYYAGFLVAEKFLNDLSITIVRTKDAHAYVPRYLRYSDDDELKSAASILDTLRARRRRADYETSSAPEETKAVAE